MAKKFKTGDKAKVIDSIGHPAIVGDIVTITGYEGTATSLVSYVKEDGRKSSCYDHRLELVAETVKKKKILYPVGTDVAARGVDCPSHCYVVAYHKGEQSPYEIGYRDTSLRPNFRMSVAQLIKYENHPSRKKKEVDSHPQETAKTPVKSIDMVDVKQLIADEVARFRKEEESRIKLAEDRIRQEMRAEAKHAVWQAQVDAQYKREEARIMQAMHPVQIIKSCPKAEKKSKMTTIREKIRYATLSSDEKVLRETGILSENGNITEQGRRVVLDILFEDKDLRSQVVSLVKKTLPKEAK